jgi:hypothetical protein
MVGFIAGILGNIVASYLYDILRAEDSKSPPLVLIIRPEELPSRREEKSALPLDQRALNRERARRALMLFLFFVITFYALWCAIYFPVLLGPGLFSASETYDLGQVKILGWFTDAVVPMSSIRTFIIATTIFLYLPLLLLGDRLLIATRRWYDKFWPVTFEAWIGLRIVSFVFLVALLAGVVTYLASNLPLYLAMLIPFAVLIAVVVFAISSESQR